MHSQCVSNFQNGLSLKVELLNSCIIPYNLDVIKIILDHKKSILCILLRKMGDYVYCVSFLLGLSSVPFYVWHTLKDRSWFLDYTEKIIKNSIYIKLLLTAMFFYDYNIVPFCKH